MKYLLLICFCISLVFFGCKGKTESNSEEIETTSSKEIASNSPEKTKVKFPVYDFGSFEPMLNRDDGTTYIINFWATWCKPCIEELPYFEQVNSEYQNQNVKVILVSLDMPGMWKTRLEPFVEKKGLKSEVVILDDPKQNVWIPKVSEDWGGGIPATVIYNGEKRSFYERGFTYEELTEELHQFIN